MKKISTLILLLSFLHVNAQVEFEKLSLDAAIKKAAATGKLVFAQFESATCQQCNDVADRGLSSPELGNSVNARFVAIRIDLNHPDRETFISLYNPRKAHSTSFISGNGDLIHVYPGTTTNYLEYLAQADKAYSKRAESSVSFAELERSWKSDISNYANMEAYINKRAAMQLPTDSLLDVYVSRLPADSSKSMRTFQFVFKHAPPLFSKADAFLRQSEELSRRAFTSFSAQDQTGIINRSMNKTVHKAIAERNLDVVKKIINFGTVNPIEAHQRRNDKFLLDYYVGTNDTANYLQTAIAYYDKYFMNETAAQLKVKDSLNRVRMMRDAGNNMKQTIDAETGIARRTFSYAPITQYYTKELNMGGWLVYTSTSDKTLLQKARSWMKQAVEVFESPEAIDTYARLLYKTDEKEQAIEWQQKAINILNQRGQNTKKYEDVLSRMKAGLKKID